MSIQSIIDVFKIEQLKPESKVRIICALHTAIYNETTHDITSELCTELLSVMDPENQFNWKTRFVDYYKGLHVTKIIPLMEKEIIENKELYLKHSRGECGSSYQWFVQDSENMTAIRSVASAIASALVYGEERTLSKLPLHHLRFMGDL